MHNIKRFFTHLLANHAILFFFTVIIIIVIIGTLCFHFIEQRDLFHAFYFTTITMATVGYGDVAPVTHAGKLLAILYGFMGAPLFVWLTGIILQSKFQNIIKHSIHEYHKELKEVEQETKKLTETLVKQKEIQQAALKKIEATDPVIKKARWKKIFNLKALFKKK